jgi:prevent-host-death family protein
MQKVIGVTELQRNFRFVFDEVTKGNTPYVLTRSSRPEAVLIPYEDFLRFQAQQEQLVIAQVAGQLGAEPESATTPAVRVAAGEEMRQIINLLASQPAPQAILDIRPSAAFQARVSALLARNKERTLSRQEEAELERCLMLEHLVRLAKARAYQQLNLPS